MNILGTGVSMPGTAVSSCKEKKWSMTRTAVSMQGTTVSILGHARNRSEHAIGNSRAHAKKSMHEHACNSCVLAAKSNEQWACLNLLVRSQHPPTQWNLRGGRWSSVEYSTYVEERKKSLKSLCFKGTQDWEFFWLRFWNLRYFFDSYVVRHVTGNDKDYLRKIPRVVW